MLAVTGLIMVYFNSVETRFGERLHVTPAGVMTTPISQALVVQSSYPDACISQYLPPPPAPDRTALFQVDADSGTLVVAVDPYTDTVFDGVIKDSTWYYFASDIHGTLLIGEIGDRLIEMAAGLAIVMWWGADRAGSAGSWRRRCRPTCPCGKAPCSCYCCCRWPFRWSG